MNINFRKISAIATSVLLTGMTMGVATAANYPAPFVSGGVANVAIVYGSGAGVSTLDQVEATSIASDLASELGTAGSVTVTGGEGETEDEVSLGGTIISGNIEATMDQNNLPSLLDTKLSWDDGDGSDDYDIHEEVRIATGAMKIITTLDDEDLTGPALTNEEGLEYRLVFEDALNVSLVGDEDADDLYLDIMGKSYLVSGMETDSITVSIADDYALKIGETVTFEGKTFTVDDIFENQVQVNGEMIASGATKKIDGVRINVDTIGYHSNSPELSRTVLKIGSDITKTYSDGDEYIGEDEDDPLWVWTMSSLGSANGYIGVKYNVKINDASDSEAGDSIKYVGDSYVFPDNFAVVTLDSITDVEYSDFSVYFDEIDLYNRTTNTDAKVEDAPVVIIEGPTDSITVNGIETNKIAIRYASNTTGVETNQTYGAIEIFQPDAEEDYTPTGKWRLATNASRLITGAITQAEVAQIEVGDSIVDIDVKASTAGDAVLILADSGDVGGEIAIDIGGVALTNSTGSFTKLGATLEDADETDVIVNGTNVSTREADILNYFGIIVQDVENNANNDEVALQVPSDRVYGIVSVKAGADVSEGTSALGNVVVKDSEVSSVSSKNLIVVGGSCINSVAANILGGSYCGAAFTTASGVGSGQFLIKSVESPVNEDKIALLVAGYDVADTQAASQYLKTKTVSTSVGNTLKGTTATSQAVVVE